MADVSPIHVERLQLFLVHPTGDKIIKVFLPPIIVPNHLITNRY
jgi:hypothetical protein